MRLGRWTPAQVYAVVFSPPLVVTGLVGFLVDRGFRVGGHLHGNTSLILELNGWHNALHLGFGAAGLASARSPRLARAFAFAWGSTALVLLAWGFTSSSSVVGLVPVNTADNYFHILDATGIVFALLSSRPEPGSPSLHRNQVR